MDERNLQDTITKATLTILVKYTLDHAISLGKDQQWQKQRHIVTTENKLTKHVQDR